MKHEINKELDKWIKERITKCMYEDEDKRNEKKLPSNANKPQNIYIWYVYYKDNHSKHQYMYTLGEDAQFG